MKVLVDFSWLRYRSKFGFKDLKCVKSGVIYNTGVIWGIYKSLSTIFHNYPDAEIWLCLDGIPTKQVTEQATYKSNRDHEESVDTLDLEYFKLANAFTVIPKVYTAYHPRMEADETIAFLAEMLEGDDTKVIFSTDMDLRQLIRSKDKIYCSKEESDEKGFVLEDENHVIQYGSRDIRGIYPHAIALYKAIIGDKSDNVHGIPKFPKDLAKMACNEYKTLEELKEWLDKPERKYSRHTIAYNTLRREWPLIESNYLITNIDPNYIPQITPQAMDTEKALKYFEYYECVKVLAGIKELIQNQQ